MLIHVFLNLTELTKRETAIGRVMALEVNRWNEQVVARVGLDHKVAESHTQKIDFAYHPQHPFVVDREAPAGAEEPTEPRAAAVVAPAVCG